MEVAPASGGEGGGACIILDNEADDDVIEEVFVNGANVILAGT